MLGVHREVLLAIIYALFLMGVAFLLEFLARHSQKRSQRYQNSGFIYFGELDYWECPAGHQLVQLNTDHQRRVTSYRAPASACNSCSLKLNCTGSDAGRLLERRWDTWVESELRRFHRGISFVLLLLASVILLAETVRYPQPHDRGMLLALLIPVAFLELKVLPSLRLQPQVYPSHLGR